MHLPSTHTFMPSPPSSIPDTQILMKFLLRGSHGTPSHNTYNIVFNSFSTYRLKNTESSLVGPNLFAPSCVSSDFSSAWEVVVYLVNIWQLLLNEREEVNALFMRIK